MKRMIVGLLLAVSLGGCHKSQEEVKLAIKACLEAGPRDIDSQDFLACLDIRGGKGTADSNLLSEGETVDAFLSTDGQSIRIERKTHVSFSHPSSFLASTYRPHCYSYHKRMRRLEANRRHINTNQQATDNSDTSSNESTVGDSILNGEPG